MIWLGLGWLALAAGCTIVLKPAEATPLCAVETFKVFEEAEIPAGVVNLVTAADPVPIGEEFTSNPMVRKITFTGSTLRIRDTAFKAALADALHSKVWPLLSSGQVKVVMDSTYPLREASRAHARMETNAHIGKIVLTV